MRSMLFVPGDSERKFARAIAGAADALVLDLEDSVAEGGKDAARQTVRGMLERPDVRPLLYVRVNALDSARTLQDLAAIMPGRPHGIVLPKASGAADVTKVGSWLDAFEAAHGIPAGATRIITVATETAEAMFGLSTYRDAGPRLEGLMWGAEDLSASLGASANRQDGRYLSPYALARDLCLMAAAAAGVMPIDTVYVDIANLDGLRREADAACRDGFTAKAVIHPSHIDAVNAAFTPNAEAVAWAQRIVEVFRNPTTGVQTLDGQMIDKPHLRAAERILARASSRA